MPRAISHTTMVWWYGFVVWNTSIVVTLAVALERGAFMLSHTQPFVWCSQLLNSHHRWKQCVGGMFRVTKIDAAFLTFEICLFDLLVELHGLFCVNVQIFFLNHVLVFRVNRTNFPLISSGLGSLCKTALWGLIVHRPQLAGKHTLASPLVKGNWPPFL